MTGVRQLLLLHVGVHKTGTTSIQKYLAQNTAALSAQGVLYPRTARPQSHPDGHHLLPWSLTGANGVCDLAPWQALVEEVRASRCQRVLISSEGLCSLRRSHVQQVAALIGDFDVRVLMYVRDPVSYMISSYKMAIALSGFADSFSEFSRTEIHRCDFRRCYEAWSGCFGAGNVQVRSYEQAVRGPGLLPDFAMAVGLDVSRLAAPAREFANQSLSDTAIQLVRAMNRVQARTGSRVLRVASRLAGRVIRHRPPVARGAQWIARPWLHTPLYSAEEVAEVRRLSAGFGITGHGCN